MHLLCSPFANHTLLTPKPQTMLPLPLPIPLHTREACRNEVMLMQRLVHPNIVAYKDSFFAKGKDQLCIVMTNCDGGDLSNRVSQQRRKLWKEDQILHWFVQVCSLSTRGTVTSSPTHLFAHPHTRARLVRLLVVLSDLLGHPLHAHQQGAAPRH